MDESQNAPVYEVSVRGELAGVTLSAFPALSAATRGGVTVLSGRLTDQAALYGVLGQIESLGLELLGVRRVT
jgi:hypothetical protein